jgi:hypothetical protein
MGLANSVGTALDAFSGAVAVQSGADQAAGRAKNDQWYQPVTAANGVTPGLLGTAYDVGTAPTMTAQAGGPANAQIPGSQTQASAAPSSGGGGGGFFGGLTHLASRVATDVGGAVEKGAQALGAGHLVHDVGHTLTNLAQWDRDAYTAGISRPLSTVLNEATNVQASGVSSLFKGNSWAQSWNESKYISPGQAATQLDRSSQGLLDYFLPGSIVVRHSLGAESAKAVASQNADPNYIQQEYGGSGFASRAISGSTDAMVSWFADPLVIAGKAATLARAGSHGTQGIVDSEAVTKAIEKPSVATMLKKTDNMDARTARQMPWVAKSANPDLLSGIFNKTVDSNVRQLAYRSAISSGMDQVAQDQLSAMAAENSAKWGEASDQAAKAKEAIANANQPFNQDIQLANYMHNGGSYADFMQAQNAAMDDAEKKLNMLGTQGRVLEDIKSLNGAVHWQPGRFDVPLAKMKAAFQSADKFGDSSHLSGHMPLGSTVPGKWVYQVLHKGLYNTPLKVLRSFSDQWPDGWLDMTSPTGGDWLHGYLSRAKGMDPEHTNTITNHWYQAGGSLEQKLQVAQVAEAEAGRAVLQHHGFSPEDAEAILAGTVSRRSDMLTNYSQRVKNASSRGYTGATDAETGLPVDGVTVHMFDDSDGVPIHVPILETMKAQGAPMLDLKTLDKWAGDNIGKFQTIKRGSGSVGDAMNASGDLFTSMWKNSVLLRLGFTPRVMTDMGLRSLSVLGGSRMLGVTKEAAGVVLHNVKANAGNYANNLLKGRLFDPDTLDNVADKAGALTTTRDAARADYLHVALQKAVNDQAVQSGLPSLLGTPSDEVVAAKLQAFHDAAGDLENLRANPSPYQKTRLGNGALRYWGVTLQDAFGGENPEWRMNQVSAARMVGHTFTRNADMEDGLSGTGNWDTMRATSQNELEAASHMPAWAHSINNQIMKDSLASKVVRNNWHEGDIQSWFKTNEGRQYLKNAPASFRSDPEDYAHRVAQHVHYTVPPEVRNYLSAGGRNQVSAKTLEKLVPQASDRPDVNGQLLTLNTTGHSGITNMMQHWQHASHKWLGTMPLNTFIYHPTAMALYRGHLQDAVDKYVSFNKLEDAQSLEFNDGLRQSIEDQAFKAAKSDLWDIMYDLSVKSTAAHQMRFIFPFFNAQQEILRHWFNIALDHPAIVQRANLLWNSPEKAGIVYDSQTGEISTPDTPIENRVLRFQIPHGISNLPGLGVLDDMGQMQINKQSINPILQGKTWYVPGAGPIVQVGVQALARFNPTILDNSALKTVLPYGPGDNISSAILPTWAKRLETGMNVDNAQYGSAFAKVYQTETIRYNEGLRSTPPNMSEIASRTRQLLILQAISSATLPFSASYNPGTQRSSAPQKTRSDVVSGTAGVPDLTHTPIQALVDQYKKMEAANPTTAMNSFYQKYGQTLFTLTMATTKTNAAVPATAQGLADLANPEIRALVAQDPSIAYAIVGPTAAQGTFDQAAYNAEMNTRIGGGNNTTFRSRLSPEDMIKGNNAQLGWQEYDQLTSLLNAKLAERGITSLNSTGASDLKALKSQFVYNMNTPGSQDYNPDWYTQYSGSTVDWNSRIQSLTNLVSDPNLTNNPARTDLQSLGTYLEGRQQLNDLLAGRPNKTTGLPTPITDKSNADLASMWDNFVSGLVMGNTQFALVYQHLLSGDPLSTGLKSNQDFQQSLSGLVGQ